jgi:hypothetical protein
MQAASILSRTEQPVLTTEEVDFLKDASSGHATRWSMAEAALMLSGVTDRVERQKYLAQIDQITEEARDATAKATTPQAKARALGKYLLKGPMHGGYVSMQCDMRKLLNEGTFNCVSSATLFEIIGHRLGMTVATITQPGHVFSRIPGFDVEPTSGRVYPADIRTTRILKGLEIHKEEVGTCYDADHPYHETGDFGVLGTIYNDRAGRQRDAKDFGQETIEYLKQACLDSTEPVSGFNVTGAMENWFKTCLSNHQAAQAAAIANLYRSTVRDTSTADWMFKKLAASQGQLASR